MKKIFLHSIAAYVARWNDSTQTYWFSKGEEEFEIPADIVEGSNDWLDKTKEGIKEEIEKGSYVKCISDKAKTTSGKHIVEKGRIVQVLSLERNETFLTVSPANAELMTAAFGPLPDHVSGKYAGTGHHRLSDFELSTEEEFLEQQSLVEEKVSKEKGVISYDPGATPYEFVSFMTTGNEPRIYTYNRHGWYVKDARIPARNLTTDEVLDAVRGKQLQYHSILRKSDGQIFTIGDTIHSSSWRNEGDVDIIVYINPQREGIFSTSKGWYSHLRTASVVNAKKKTKAIPVPAPNRRGAAMAIPEVMMEMPEMIDFDIPIPAERENNNDDAYEVNLIRDTRINDIYSVRDFSIDGGARISLFPITHPAYNENEYGGLDSAEFIEDNYTIHAVTRLHDNKMFTVEQQITHRATLGVVNINYFEITRTGVWINGIYSINSAEQAFISDDGVYIPLGHTVYFISNQGGENMSQLQIGRNTRKVKGLLYYSTREAAEQKLKEINNEKN